MADREQAERFARIEAFGASLTELEATVSTSVQEWASALDLSMFARLKALSTIIAAGVTGWIEFANEDGPVTARQVAEAHDLGALVRLLRDTADLIEDQSAALGIPMKDPAQKGTH